MYTKKAKLDVVTFDRCTTDFIIFVTVTLSNRFAFRHVTNFIFTLDDMRILTTF